MFGKLGKVGSGNTQKKELIRLNGKLNEVVSIHDSSGVLLHKVVSPIMVEFHFRDVVQVIVGATILAIPLGYTEETWVMGLSLPLINVLGLMFISMLFISTFVYYNYYQGRFRRHRVHFFRRVISTYVLSFVLVAIVLSLIGKAPWTTDVLLAIKRIIIVTFPASMSAAIADILK